MIFYRLSLSPCEKTSRSDGATDRPVFASWVASRGPSVHSHLVRVTKRALFQFSATQLGHDTTHRNHSSRGRSCAQRSGVAVGSAPQCPLADVSTIEQEAIACRTIQYPP